MQTQIQTVIMFVEKIYVVYMAPEVEQKVKKERLQIRSYST